MLKRKGNNKVSRKSQLVVIGSLLIIIGISIIGVRFYLNYSSNKNEKETISSFFEEEKKKKEDISSELTEKENVEKPETNTNKMSYIAILKIPKIGLEKGLVSKDSYYNNVNRNIQILNDSDLPNIEKGNVILAGHSGNGGASYFRNVYKLTTNDIVSIFFDGYEYQYRVVNSYDVDKIGTANITRNAEKSTLTLITCRHNTNKQIIVICELVKKI